MLKLPIYIGVLLLMLTKVCNGMQSSLTMTDDAFNTLRSEILELRNNSPLTAIEQLNHILEKNKQVFTLRQTLRLTYAKALFQITSNLADDALETLIQCKQLSSQLGEPFLEYYYYSYSGRLFTQLEIYELALENYRIGYEIASKIDNQSLIKQSENNIGHILFYLGKYKDAEQYYESFYQYGVKQQIPSYQATALNNLGEVSLAEQNIEKAYDQFNQSLRLRETNNFEHNSAWSYTNIAKVYLIKQQYDKAIEHINKAITIHDKFADTIEKLKAQLVLASIFQAQDKPEQASILLNNIVTKAKDINHDQTFYQAQSMLKLSYKALKNYDSALQAAEAEIITQNRILQKQARISLQHLIAKTALQTKELEVLNLTKEREIALAKQKHSQQKIHYLFIAAFIVITLTLLFILRIRKKNKQLSITLNDLETTQRQLVESEKASALTTLVSGMAHQLNTPLGVIITANSIQQEKLQQLESLIEEKKLTVSDMNFFVKQSKEAITLSQSNTEKADEMIRRFKLISAELEGSTLSDFALKPFIESKLEQLSKQSLVTVNYQVNGEDTNIYNYSDVLFKVINQLVIN